MGADHNFKVSVENYLKTIWIHEQKDGSPITNKELSVLLEVSKPSVSQMIQKLVSHKLVFKDKQSRGFRLTAQGADRAAHLLRAHRLVEMYLKKTLKIDGLFLHLEAERLEHAVSEQLINEIDRYLAFPKTDFTGAPIPRLPSGVQASRSLSEFQDQVTHGIKLSDFGSGVCEVVRIYDDSKKLLKQLERLNIGVGDTLKLLAVDGQSKDLHFQYKTQKFSLTPKEASSIIVRLL